MAKYLNFDSMVNEFCDYISSMIPNVSGYYVADLAEKAYIETIQKILYINNGPHFTSTCNPETIINMSKYIDLSLVLKRNSILTYFHETSGISIKISLKLTHFNENNLPIFNIINMQDIIDLLKELGYNSIDAIDYLINIIKSDDNGYLYKLLLLDSWIEKDTDDKDTQPPVKPDIPENVASTSIEVQTIKPILKDNSWEEVIYASENNCIPNTWKVGDEIDLTLLSGKYNETVTLQIWDFNHYDKSDGTGKANILFGMKHLMKTEQQMNLSDTNIGGWNKSYMKNVVMNDIYEAIPKYIRSHIKEVNTYANPGDHYTYEEQGLLSTDKVFIPGASEIDDAWKRQNKTETGQSIISIFKDGKNRIKRMDNGNGPRGQLWTRSPFYNNNSLFCILNYGGNAYSNTPEYSGGVCFCFNI